MAEAQVEQPPRVLDPIERATEVLFGLLMAMTFVGSLSAASSGREEVRTMMYTAIGCNLAWGLADAVMYLVRTVTQRTRNRTLAARLLAEKDPAAGVKLLGDALPQGLSQAAGPQGMETLRQHVVRAPAPAAGPNLGLGDFKCAFGVFLLVVLATFPVVIPFMIFDQASVAIRASNGVAIAMLFIAGAVLARYAGGSPWRGGAWMAVTGVILIGAIIALGG